MSDTLGVILAGGLATRMGGGDKGRLEIGGTSILQRVIDRLAPQVSGMVLNANGDASRFSDFALPVASDSIDGYAGPLAGVLAGMDWAAEQGASHVVSVAADTPFFPVDLVHRLKEATQEQDAPIALAATPDPKRGIARQPTFGLWPVELRDDLRRELKDGLRKVVLWTDKFGTAMAVFEVGPFDPFLNVNTPEDLELARSIESRHHP